MTSRLEHLRLDRAIKASFEPGMESNGGTQLDSVCSSVSETAAQEGEKMSEGPWGGYQGCAP